MNNAENMRLHWQEFHFERTYAQMDKIICYTSLLPPDQEKQLTFWDILLDDRWTEGGFHCPDELYHEIGNINQKLHAKLSYEFLLRASQKYPITAVGCELSVTDIGDEWECFRTDCYVIGKYLEHLRDHNYFDSIVMVLLEQANQMPWKKEGITFLENMISHSPEFYEIDDNTQPILLYRDTGICCNLLNLFIEGLGEALQKCHQRVEFFDATVEGKQALTRYIGQHFKAIIGVQTYFFAIMMQDKTTNLHDLIHGPKYNIILDHPGWMENEIKQAPKNYYLLLHDRNYINFASKLYHNIAGCIHFPPAGMLPDSSFIPMERRIYDISFIGSYRNYRERLGIIRYYDKTYRHMVAHYLKIMRQHPDYPGERALEQALKKYNIPYDDAKFIQLFCDMKQAYFCILLYYREKIISTLINAGIKVHVFSESWQNFSLINHPNLICHPKVDAGESLQIMQNSKISLNIMSWHKDGLTERILNSMLCQSVVLSDQSTALQEQFIDGQDISLFSLENLSVLPQQVNSLLADNQKLTEMAMNGYRKALANHTWTQRAEQLIELWD